MPKSPTELTESETELRRRGVLADTEGEADGESPDTEPATAEPKPEPSEEERQRAAWQEIEAERGRLREERAGLGRAKAEGAKPEPEPPATDFHRRWWEGVQAELAATPELRDQSSALGQAVQAILREHRVYSLSPEGFRQATALARARQEAAEAPALRAKLEALAKENARLVGLTSVTGTPPMRSSREETKDLSERDLRRLAAEMDSGS